MQFRVRDHGEVARLEFDPEGLKRVQSEPLNRQVVEAAEVVVAVALDVREPEHAAGHQILLQREHADVGQVLAALEQAVVPTANAEVAQRPEHALAVLDRDAAIAAYESSGYLPAGDLSAFIFREELRYAVPIYAPFWMWAEKVGKEKAWSAWHEFWEIYQQKYLNVDD